jgi:hypothetical protein
MVFRHCIWTLPLLIGPALGQVEGISWQEAVARLAAERTRAETCARLLKSYGDSAAVSKGDQVYGAAKAEVDGVIAGLVVALAQDDEPTSLPDLEARLQRGIKGRESFCADVTPLAPAASGEKNLIIDLAGEVLGPLIEAVQVIYLDHREDDRLTRATIQTQLEATKWPAFAEVSYSN